MNENYSIRRLRWLLYADFVNGYRSLLLESAAPAGVILVMAMISADGFDASGRWFYVTCFGVLLFLWGVITTCRAFRELHDKNRNEAYLLIPASASEKTVARLLAVTLGFTAYLLVFMSLISLVAAGLNLWLFGERMRLFNPFDPLVWALIPAYLFVQSFYFLGAAWFRKAHFIKTSLAVILAAAGLAIFSLVTLRIVFAPYWGSLGDMGYLLVQAFELYGGAFGLLEAVFEILLPVACWFIAWLRVRETQVSDGV